MLVLSMVFVILAVGYPQIRIGDKAPLTDLTMKGVDGDMVSISKVKRGNGVVIIFSSNLCPFVRSWEDRYNDIKKWANENNSGLLVVNSNWAKRSGYESYEAMKVHAIKIDYHFPYVQDQKSRLANEFGAQTTPHVFLFDGNLNLVYKGAIDDNYKNKDSVKNQWLKDALIAVGNGEEIEIKETPPVGCSIKRDEY
jgi:thioredoxin-related protein